MASMILPRSVINSPLVVQDGATCNESKTSSMRQMPMRWPYSRQSSWRCPRHVPVRHEGLSPAAGKQWFGLAGAMAFQYSRLMVMINATLRRPESAGACDPGSEQMDKRMWRVWSSVSCPVEFCGALGPLVCSPHSKQPPGTTIQCFQKKTQRYLIGTPA